jgi:pimeloyl-ACP methyl ester carboxylesterase
VDYALMTFPVMLLQGDFGQQEAVDEAAIADIIAQFPNATFYWIVDAGQFSQLEQPQTVTDTIVYFLSSLAG